MTEPGERVGGAIERQPRSHEPHQGDEQGRSRVAEGAGMVRVSAGVDDFMQVQRWVADLHQQHRQAQACEQQIGLPAIECVSPRDVQPVLRLPARSHEHLEIACCG
jgi:hypothetical protein